MIIENSDAFYGWLMSYLGRLCDADPAALAKYVMALVKKDKPESELKEFCSDQLDVFLTKETKAFVDLLFETLRTKSYLVPGPLFMTSPPNSVHLIETCAVSPVNPAFNGNCSTVKTAAVPTPVVDTFPVNNVPSPVKSDKVVGEKKKTDFNPDLDVRERRFTHRSRSSSSSESSKRCRSRSRSRENEEKHRCRVTAEDRHRRTLHSRRYESRHRGVRNKRPSESSDRTERSERERERDREVRRERLSTSVVGDRQRSRSPVRSRSNSFDRSRSRSSSWSSHSRSRSWSRSRERSKEASQPTSRSKGTSPDRQSDHGDTDYRVGGNVAKSSSPSPRSADGNKKKHVVRVAKRCKDYDEKGYCMRGDLCVYDHGTDPLVVENVSVLNFGGSTATPPVAPNPGCVLPSMILQHQKTDGESSLPPLPPSSPPPPPPPPPLPPPAQGTFTPEPYNPEAPGIYRGKRDQVVPSWSTSVPPPHLPPGSTHSSSPSMPLSSRIAGVPPFNPSEPPPGFHTNPKLQRTRELIGVPTLDSNAVEKNPVGSIDQHDSSAQTSTLQRSQSNVTQVTTSVTSVTVAGGSFTRRKQFDYNRLGVRPPLRQNIFSDRCTLELRKIPRTLNTVCLLDKHFSRFGPIKAIQTGYGNDPEAALVEYTTHAAATAAYRNSEAVLNNRFIKVFWHYKDTGNNIPLPSSDTGETSIVTDEPTPVLNIEQVVSPDEQTEPVDICASSDLISTTNRQESELERAPVVFSQKGGGISRTIFNPAAMKKSNVAPPPSVLRKCKEDQRREAFKKKLEFHKKKQAFLQSHVESQKMLLDKLAKSKSEKEKDYLKKTIGELSGKILVLQSDLKRECEEIANVMKTVNGKFTANKTEAEKELLDAEMDLYNKQHRGDDVTELMYKVHELKQQAMGLLESKLGRGRGIRGGRLLRGRGRGRTMSAMMARSIDHRPRKFLVVSPANIDKDVLQNYFMQFGEVEGFEASDIGAFVTYRTRKEAETAFVLTSKCNNLPAPLHSLNLAWCHDSSSSEQSGKSDLSVPSLGSERGSLHSQLLEEEEEEEEEEDDEEDSEARSWRR